MKNIKQIILKQIEENKQVLKRIAAHDRGEIVIPTEALQRRLVGITIEEE
jgi:hypothetical protein